MRVVHCLRKKYLFLTGGPSPSVVHCLRKKYLFLTGGPLPQCCTLSTEEVFVPHRRSPPPVLYTVYGRSICSSPAVPSPSVVPPVLAPPSFDYFSFVQYTTFAESQSVLMSQCASTLCPGTEFLNPEIDVKELSCN